jgi:hypothetical protein
MAYDTRPIRSASMKQLGIVAVAESEFKFPAGSIRKPQHRKRPPRYLVTLVLTQYSKRELIAAGFCRIEQRWNGNDR